MIFGIVVFPGSNCDEDAYHAATHVLGQQAEYIWHKDTDLKGADVVILPGGFAHGDYLRTGAMARFSPIMREVRAFAERGGPVLGICNGFQILLEAGLLPGAMLRNRSLKYRCEHVYLRVEQTDTPFTRAAHAGQVLSIPIGHGEGNYFATPEMLDKLEANRQVILRYTDPAGRLDDQWNPNGSVHAIAGLCNETRNVVGMMPHPERACEPLVGGVDGKVILDSIVRAFASGGCQDGPAGPALQTMGERGAQPSREAESLRSRPSDSEAVTASGGGAPRAEESACGPREESESS